MTGFPSDVPLANLLHALRNSGQRIRARVPVYTNPFQVDGTPIDKLDIYEYDVMEEAARWLENVYKCLETKHPGGV